MIPIGVKSNKKEKFPKDEIPVIKRKVQSINHVRKNRLKMNKDFELLIHKLKTQYYNKDKEEYDEIRILEDGVFSSVMEYEMFFNQYRGVLYWT